MICKNCKRDVECESCEPYCICCYAGKRDSRPDRGKSCMFPWDCKRIGKSYFMKRRYWITERQLQGLENYKRKETRVHLAIAIRKQEVG